MKDENYKNGYHDGYAEALITLMHNVEKWKDETGEIDYQDIKFLIIEKMLK